VAQQQRCVSMHFDGSIQRRCLRVPGQWAGTHGDDSATLLARALI
jgi:hypothetical protein